MNLSVTDHLFTLAIIMFFAGACFGLLFCKKHRAANTLSNLFCMAGSAMGTISVVFHLLKGGGPVTVLNSVPGIPNFSLQLKYDNLSAYFLLVLFILTFAVSLYSIGYISHYYGKRNVGIFNFLYCTFILSMMMVMLAGNLLTFFIAWELMSVVSYFLVVFEHERSENVKAGTVYIIMTHLGAALIMIAFMIMNVLTGETSIIGNGAFFTALPEAAKNACFLLLLVGFGTKAGIIPFHIWLPKAHPAASSNISALMSGFMIKTAIYGIVRFIICGFGGIKTWWGMTILILGIVAAVLGVAYALMEHNIKRLLAFHSIENIGIIFIGLGMGMIAYSKEYYPIAAVAIAAALFHTLNHALFKGGLFLGAGAIQYATHTRDIEQLGGLIKKMPVTAVFVLCFSLAISAIVPFNGFVSEWLTYQSIFAFIPKGSLCINMISIIAAAALAFAGALAAVCFVKLFGISFLGLPRSEHAGEAKEVPPTMLGGMGILAALCLVAGLFPKIILNLLDKVLIETAALKIYPNLSGGTVPVFSGLTVSGNKMSMIAILAVILALIAATVPAVRIIGGKADSRKYGTWDCGFVEINERMQYTATGFSKPIRIVFRILFRPSRTLAVKGEHPKYYPDKMEYKVGTVSVFEKYFYDVIIRGLHRFSQRVKLSVQTGSIHMYLSYILVTVLALMLYSRLF